jgi:outer membrane protein assembly factor BamE (lipoprotein component of BamABCDE complex)
MTLNIWRTCLLTLSALTLGACASTPANEIYNIHRGMEKADVLEKMGSPLRTERENGNDIWIYRFYEDGGEFKEKVIIFEKGQVTYSGAPLTPDTVLKGTPNESHPAPTGEL